MRLIIPMFIFSFLTVNFVFAQNSITHPAKLDVLPDVVYRTGWALIVGINDYPDPFKLKYATAGADGIADVLQTKYGFDKNNIKILKDGQATKAGIINELGSLADPSRVKPEDCIFFFFSGRSQTITLPDEKKMGFLIPQDAKVNLSDEKPNPAEYVSSCIGMDELSKAASLIPAKHIIFIMDACYSGSSLPSPREAGIKTPDYLKKALSNSSQQMITAGSQGEVSAESADQGYSTFTYKLLDCLERNMADANKDGVITGSELYTYLKMEFYKIPNMKQKPQFYSSGDGDFLFIPQSTFAIIEMDKGGRIVLEFYPKDAPNTVDNFIKLAQKGFYNGLKFHRVVPGFVVQGGDPRGNGTGGPGYKIKAEFNSRKHLIGTLAMARSQDPDSAGSQFYICLEPQPGLDGQYTVFGQAIEGMNVVKGINKDDVMKKITIVGK